MFVYQVLCLYVCLPGPVFVCLFGGEVDIGVTVSLLQGLNPAKAIAEIKKMLASS